MINDVKFVEVQSKYGEKMEISSMKGYYNNKLFHLSLKKELVSAKNKFQT